MIKNLAILALALLTTSTACLVDLFLLRDVILPGPPYFVSILITAYFLSPRATIGVTVYAMALKLITDLAQQAPIYLMIMYFIALAMVGFLSTALVRKIRRETALAVEAETSRQQAIDILESITDSFLPWTASGCSTRCSTSGFAGGPPWTTWSTWSRSATPLGASYT